MKIHTLRALVFGAALMGGLFCLSSCQNGNIFGGIHDRGDSGDTKSLLNDADQALRAGDYSQALSLYNRVLSSDPDNAKALYGSSAALLGTSGLDVGILVSNILKQTPGSSSINGIGDLISQSRLGISVSQTTDPNSVLYGINLESVNAVIDQIICRLQKIVSGATDGSIAPNNTDVLVNMAILEIIRAALRPIRAGYLDVVNTTGDYTVKINVDPANQAAFCADSNNQEMIKNMARDVASAYVLLNRAVFSLNLSNDRLITKLRNDVADVLQYLYDPAKITTLDASCGNLVTQSSPAGAGINAGTYQNYNDVFNPPSGC